MCMCNYTHLQARVASDSKETNLGSSDQEAFTLASENTGVVLVP